MTRTPSHAAQRTPYFVLLRSTKKAKPIDAENPIFAVKLIHKGYATKHGRISAKQLAMEVSLHSRVGQHPHVIEWFASGEDAIWRWIAMEYAEGGDLFDKIEADTTATVSLGVVSADSETAFAELTKYRRRIRRHDSDLEKLPIIFSDFINCLMGDPTDEKTLALVGPVAESGAEYYKNNTKLSKWHHGGNVNFVVVAKDGSGRVATAADVPTEAVHIYPINHDDVEHSPYQAVG